MPKEISAHVSNTILFMNFIVGGYTGLQVILIVIWIPVFSQGAGGRRVTYLNSLSMSLTVWGRAKTTTRSYDSMRVEPMAM